MFLPLYIDPGTGSMLFSLFIGIAAAATFGFRALFVKLRFLISGGKIKEDETLQNLIPYVIFSDHKRYWNVFKPVCDEFENRKIDIVYYTASEDDPVFSADYKYVHPEFIGSGNKPYAKLNLLKADIVLATTPGLGVYQWKRSKDVKYYVHIPHSIDDLSMYKMFGLDHYDAVCISGQHQEKSIRFLESIRPSIQKKELEYTGLTYFDLMLAKKKNYEIHVLGEKPLVLLAPSWGQNSLLVKYGEKFVNQLIETGYEIVIRPHPQSFTADANVINHLKEVYKDNPNISWNTDNDNFDILNKSDIMISDFSSVMFDYAFIFNKPFIYADVNFDFIQYDADWCDEKWQFTTLDRIGVKLDEKDFMNLKTLIDSTLYSSELSQERENVRKEVWKYPGESGKRVADFLIKKHQELYK